MTDYSRLRASRECPWRDIDDTEVVRRKDLNAQMTLVGTIVSGTQDATRSIEKSAEVTRQATLLMQDTAASLDTATRLFTRAIWVGGSLMALLCLLAALNYYSVTQRVYRAANEACD